jgi:hypothetical protein
MEAAVAVTRLTGEGARLTVLTGNRAELCGVAGTVLDECGGDRSFSYAAYCAPTHLLYDCFFSFFFTCLRMVQVPSVGRFFKSFFFFGHMRIFGEKENNNPKIKKITSFAS